MARVDDVAVIFAGLVPRQPPPIVVGSEAPTGGTGDPVGWSPLDRSTGSVLYLADPAGTVRVLDVDRGEIVDHLPLRPALGDQPLLLARIGRAAVLQTDRVLLESDDMLGPRTHGGVSDVGHAAHVAHSPETGSGRAMPPRLRCW